MLVLVAAVVVASGCVDQDIGNSGGQKGLQITEYSASDSTLRPGQRALITLKLANYHRENVEINDMSLYQLGELEVVSGKSCTPPKLEPARNGLAPEMECTWSVQAPEDIEGFNSKSYPVKLNLNYTATFSNTGNPFKIRFEELEEISSSEQKEVTYSNGEVVLTLTSDNPAPTSGSTLEVKARGQGQGKIVSDFEFDYTPEKLFKDCPEKVEKFGSEPVVFSCQISSDQAGVTRNLIISTSYKYVKPPTLNIEVIKG